MEFVALRDIVVLFGLALLTVLLLRRFNLPSIIGFLITGVVAGPHALRFIKNAHQVEQMAEIGVVLLLFTIGIEFSLKELMRIRHMVLLGGGLQLALTIAVVAVIGTLYGFPMSQGVFFGFLVALSSTAILLKLMMDAGETDTPQGKTALGILIFQDLCIVPLMLFTPFLAGGGSGLVDIAIVSAKAVAVVVGAHFGARFVIPWIFEQVVKTRSRELFVLSIIFIGMGTAWLTSHAGLSLALGAFIAGLAISESEYSHQALSDIMPFREAFMSLFFISVGMLLKPTILLKFPFLLIGMVLAIILIKTVLSAAVVFVLGLPMRIAIIAALSLAQIGEFSFVLSRSGLSHGLLTPETYQLFLAASIATMALTPLCMKVSGPVADYLTKLLPHEWTRGRSSLAQNGDKVTLDDHIIIVGFGVNGKNLARVLKNLEIPHVAIDTNPFTVRNQTRMGEQIIFGDASKPEILTHAGIEQARIVVVAISDAAASRRLVSLARKMNPSIHVIVRTRYLLEMEPLFMLGANEVIPEEFETSVEILSRVLKRFLIPQDVVEECIADVRRDGYEMLRTASKRHSHAVGITGFLSGAEVGSFRVQKGSPVEGESLREGLLRAQSGVTLVAVKRGSDITPNPDPVWQFSENDIALVLGTPEQMRAAAKLFEPARAAAGVT
ncbi:Kef-type potassium transporter, NAD-binding protein [Citrifermentans bemidjiense Bem]|uniref:Kef-type potassium transporter, NAD-binding protein n=1 Tax=Citrifermentans bemidjiense (strain ATCC BAA-1014 / DSM 16622 / JCM 12645 / Bem) TaxID=404380 RepID=B5EEA3_CITBB|nr:monovalent cation:proton antiporter family protein [Citrifermentans bemidjiense]ACH39248.1 Kef-type potassium transporter, NAD-binding protein [Citrifermentans bemidjiense Bem]